VVLPQLWGLSSGGLNQYPLYSRSQKPFPEYASFGETAGTLRKGSLQHRKDHPKPHLGYDWLCTLLFDDLLRKGAHVSDVCATGGVPVLPTLRF
jgi:hypothetical protein